MSFAFDNVSEALESTREKVLSLQSQLISTHQPDLASIERELNETIPGCLADLRKKLEELQASVKPEAFGSMENATQAKNQAVEKICAEVQSFADLASQLSSGARLHPEHCAALAASVGALCRHFSQQIPGLIADTPSDAIGGLLERVLSKAISALLSALALIHTCGFNDPLTFLSSYWVQGVEESPFYQAHNRLIDVTIPGASVAGLKCPIELEDAYQAWLAQQLTALAASPVEFAREALLKRLDEVSSPSTESFKESLRRVQLQISEPAAAAAPEASTSDAGHQESAYIHIEPSELEILRQIGTGAFATVHEALMAGERVAVKRINDQPGAFEQLCNEVQVMNKFHSAYIVPLYGGYLQGSAAFLVMELVGRGALFDVLVHGKAQLPWPLRWSFARDVALSVYYLHSREPPIVHRDLKSDNLLVTGGWRVKLTDFGLSVPTTPTPPCGGCGTPRWMAPELELFPDQPYDLPADVYSVGMILWEIGTRSIPWEYDLSNSIIAAVCAGKRPDIPKEVPRSLSSLIRACWHQDPKQRPTTRELARLIEKEDIPDDLSAVMEDESLDKARQQLKALEDQHKALQLRRETIEKEIESAQRAAKDAIRQREEVLRQTQEARARADNLSKKAKGLELDKDRLLKQIATQREKLESEKKKAQKKLKQAEQARQKEIDEQQEQIVAARENLEKLRKQRDDLVAQKPG